MGKTPHNERNAALFRQLAPAELKKGELRKLQIVEAAIECLGTRGWNGTNYETVGKLCNMKRPHVAYHYPVWNDLLQAVFKMVYATGQAIVVDYLRDDAKLESYVEGTFHWISKHRSHGAVVTLLWHLAAFDPEFRKLSTEVKRLGTERLHAILYPGKTIDKRSERWQRAVAGHGLIVGRCVEVISTDFGVPLATLVRQIVAKL